MSNNTMNFAPKNIRQIGVTLPNDKIYIEDYVMTYIKQLSNVLSEDNRILLLVGCTKKEDEVDYSCISGVVELIEEERCCSYNDLLLQENLKKLTRIKEDYYGDMDFVGLCVISRNEWLKFEDGLYQYFQSGMMGDILLVRDIMNEEQVYRYRNTNFIKQRGYYIYYERNESMQNYMLCMKDGKSIEYGYSPSEIIAKNIDEKIRTFSIPKNAVYSTKGNPYTKYKTIMQKKWDFRWKYALVSMCAIGVLIAGVIKVDKLEKITKEKANQLVNKTTEVINNDESELKVETVVSELVMKDDDVAAEVEESKANDEDQNEEINTVTLKPEEEKQEYKEESIDENNNKSINVNEKSTKEVGNEGDNRSIDTSINKIKESEKYYVVRKGDALVDISRRMYGTHKKVAMIKRANGIEDEDKIFIGQRLLIP